MSTPLQEQPVLLRQLACAALEMKGAGGEDVFKVLDRVADDIDRAGFPALARALAEIFQQGRGSLADASDQVQELNDRINELEKELETEVEKRETAVEAAGEVIRDAAVEWIAKNGATYNDEQRGDYDTCADDLKKHLDEKIADLDAEELGT